MDLTEDWQRDDWRLLNKVKDLVGYNLQFYSIRHRDFEKFRKINCDKKKLK